VSERRIAPISWLPRGAKARDQDDPAGERVSDQPNLIGCGFDANGAAVR